MKLVWSAASLRDLSEIAAHIAEDSYRTAESVETRIDQEARLLSRFPRSGRPGRVPGTRERVVRKTPFVLAYRIVSGKVRVLRVYRGARKWPAHL